MNHGDALAALKALLAAVEDGTRRMTAAADWAAKPELRGALEARSQEYAVCVRELRACIHALGGATGAPPATTDDDASPAPMASATPARGDRAVLAAMATVEHLSCEAYAAARAVVKTELVMAVLERQHARARSQHARWRQWLVVCEARG